jgi:ABC-type phosphate transport system auxiliary subunit
MSLVRIIGIVLLIAGVVVLIFGAYNLISYSTSTGGRAANRIAGFFGGRTSVVQNSLIQIGIGAVCAVVGLVLYKKR